MHPLVAAALRFFILSFIFLALLAVILALLEDGVFEDESEVRASLAADTTPDKPSKILRASQRLVIGVTKRANCTQSERLRNGDMATILYKGFVVSSGNMFDSNLFPPEPMPVILGKGGVIRGIERGILGACVGEHRTLSMPASLAYGSAGSKNMVPPHSAVVYHVRVVSRETRKAHQGTPVAMQPEWSLPSAWAAERGDWVRSMTGTADLDWLRDGAN